VNIEIQTYWNVETLYFVFNAVASMMAGAGFGGI
jgi:conjugal transfer mating pair stabilization protein TraG